MELLHSPQQLLDPQLLSLSLVLLVLLMLILVLLLLLPMLLLPMLPMLPMLLMHLLWLSRAPLLLPLGAALLLVALPAPLLPLPRKGLQVCLQFLLPRTQPPKLELCPSSLCIHPLQSLLCIAGATPLSYGLRVLR